MSIRIRFLAPSLATLLLVACGGGMSGTYRSEMGSIEFASGKVDLNIGITGTHEMKYSVDGNKILLHSPQGNLVLTRNKDGSIDTPWGTMKKTD